MTVRWQDDPMYGECSEYGRSSHLAPVLAVVAAILVAIGVAVLLARAALG